MNPVKYSDLLADWLHGLGYTHCFSLAGGNIMHLLESVSRRFTVISVAHEVAAGIAVEYFNETSRQGKAFALVTAGPGLTNIVTAMAGAYLESRELLVIGGQVKTADLSRGGLRQNGIQEIDGVGIARPVTVLSKLLDSVIDRTTFADYAQTTQGGRPGPVFLEIPLDIQGRLVDRAALETHCDKPPAPAIPDFPAAGIDKLAALIRQAQRPMILIGGGVSRATASKLQGRFARMGLPIATTWNGADRIAADHPNYVGRPNTWGQRYANILLQQSDLLLALGTRLGMQQTGFNWQQFAPLGQVVQVDCDQAELSKGHPQVAWPIRADANGIIEKLSTRDFGRHEEWLEYCREVKKRLPLIEDNTTGEEYVSPYAFVDILSNACRESDVIIPCSSGSAFTVMMQTFAQKRGQLMVTNKGLASMGYGLSGAIGAAFANPGRRTILVEGDGGFAQNVQEIGTAQINRLNLKIFIFDDNGYASIRMTQKNYFGGRYVGCDRATGLGLPQWDALFAAYAVPCLRIGRDFQHSPAFRQLFEAEGTAAFILPIDPGQTYFPKIMSRVSAGGAMESNPLHLMSPELDDEKSAYCLCYLLGSGF